MIGRSHPSIIQGLHEFHKFVCNPQQNKKTKGRRDELTPKKNTQHPYRKNQKGVQ